MIALILSVDTRTDAGAHGAGRHPGGRDHTAFLPREPHDRADLARADGQSRDSARPLDALHTYGRELLAHAETHLPGRHLALSIRPTEVVAFVPSVASASMT